MDQVEKKTASLFMDMFSELKIKKVSIYIPVHNEVPTKRIIQLIIGSKTECYLPVIDQDLNNKKMKFAEFNHETALVKNNKFYIQAGAGIVADSIPEKEYQETVIKAKALINALN